MQQSKKKFMSRRLAVATSILGVFVLLAAWSAVVEGQKKVAVFSGGGIRAAIGTMVAMRGLKGYIDFDEYHALSGGGWGLSLSSIPYPLACSGFTMSLEDKKKKSTFQSSHKMIGPRAYAGINLSSWSDQVANFLRNVKGVKGPLTSFLPKLNAFFHVTQLVKAKPVNDCWFTNKPNLQGGDDFGCIQDPSNPSASVSPNSRYTQKSMSKDSIDTLRALSLSSAAWSTSQVPSIARKSPFPYHLNPSSSSSTIDLTDGGDLVNTPVLSVLQDFAKSPQDTLVYVFDYSVVLMQKSKLKSVRDLLASVAPPYSMKGILKKILETASSLGLSVNPSKPAEDVCFQNLQFTPPASSNTNDVLTMRIFGLCGKGDDITFPKSFPTLDIDSFFAKHGTAKQWTSQRLSAFTESYSAFVVDNLVSAYKSDKSYLNTKLPDVAVTSLSFTCDFESKK